MVRKINKEYIVKALQTKGQYISAWDNEGMKYDFFKTLNVYNDKKVNEKEMRKRGDPVNFL